MLSANLTKAKNTKNDEFYTQWADIEKEVGAYIEYNPDVFRGKTILCPCDDPEWSNFTKYFALHFADYGIKKLISTSYAADSKTHKQPYQLSLLEMKDPRYDENKTNVRGKIFMLEGGGKVNIDNLQWDYMDGDGEFRSDEVKKLRDEADIIITNPPFSLFRDFRTWILEAEKDFLIIGTLNAITYKEVFPLLKDNHAWLGPSITSGDVRFGIPEGIANLAQVKEVITDGQGNKIYITKVPGVRWFTNLDHGRRHQPLSLMSMGENLKYSKHAEIRGKKSYDKYVNFDGIEVPFTDAIPADYGGAMGVPISFFDKYCPEQFSIIGVSSTLAEAPPDNLPKALKGGPRFYTQNADGSYNRRYDRVVIKHKGATK
jgi:hypothetical protein